MDSVLNDSDELFQDSYEQQEDDEGNEIVYEQTAAGENEVMNDDGSGMEQEEQFVEEDVEASEEQISFEHPMDNHEEQSEKVAEDEDIVQEDNDEQDVDQNDLEQQSEEILYEDQQEEINDEEVEHYPEQTSDDENFVAYKEEDGSVGEESQEENTVDQEGDVEDVHKNEVDTEELHDASFEEIQYDNAEEEVIEDEHEATYDPKDNVQQHKAVDNEDIDDPENIHYDQEESYPTVGDTSEEIISHDDAADENFHDSEENKSPAEDDDYEDVVEVEEDQPDEEGEDENVAQHESDSENEVDEEEAIEEDTKLDHMSDYDLRDSDEEDDELYKKDNEKPSDEAAARILDSDSDEDKEKEGVGDLIADIFGKSDDEDEEFTGFGEEESSAMKKNKSLGAVISSSDEEDDDVSSKKPTSSRQEDSSSDEGVRDGDKGSGGMVYDFDVMLQRKKDERKGRRRKDGGTFISDADDIINAMLTKMREAAVADREANEMKKPALNKLKMLPTVVRHLKKQDLKEAFVDMGMIAAIADWLTLLPDRSLPHISIRAELLGVLHDLPTISSETLKSSGIGRAIMVLFKHPREIRKHKESAGRLINKWSRPIFGLNENFKSMSRGEREQRDLDQMPQSKRRKLSSGRSDAEKSGEAAPEPGQLRPGERGFVMRARVPMPSNKDYVVRPKWNVEEEDEERPTGFKRGKQKKDERLEKHIKTFADRRKNLKMQRAVGISIEGNKMPLT